MSTKETKKSTVAITATECIDTMTDVTVISWNSVVSGHPTRLCLHPGSEASQDYFYTLEWKEIFRTVLDENKNPVRRGTGTFGWVIGETFGRRADNEVMEKVTDCITTGLMANGATDIPQLTRHLLLKREDTASVLRSMENTVEVHDRGELDVFVRELQKTNAVYKLHAFLQDYSEVAWIGHPFLRDKMNAYNSFIAKNHIRSGEATLFVELISGTPVAQRLLEQYKAVCLNRPGTFMA